MKILHHHRTRATDAQRVHILEMVAAFRALGHTVEIVSLVDTEREQSDEKAREEAQPAGWKQAVKRLPFASDLIQLGYNALGFLLLLRRLWGARFDMIYERYSLYNFCGVLAARLWRIPCVLEVNSPLAMEMSADGEIGAPRLARRVEKLVCNSARRVVVISGPLRDILIAEGVRAEKIVVMTNGVNLDRFQPVARNEALARELGLDGKVVIGFVGWFRKWHGLEFLVETFAEANLAADGAALLLIGDGPAMPDVRRYIEEYGLKSVVLTGALPHGRIPRYLSLVDIAVQPAANEYCCPMKILEYMALAKPVVGPRQANIAEIVQEGDDARLFLPANKSSLAQVLRALVRDAAAREDMGKKARQAIFDRGYLWLENARRVAALVQAEGD